MLRSRLAMALPALIFAMAPGPLLGEAPTPCSGIERVVRRYYAEVANEADQPKAAGVVDELLSKDFFFTFGNGRNPLWALKPTSAFSRGTIAPRRIKPGRSRTWSSTTTRRGALPPQSDQRGHLSRHPGDRKARYDTWHRLFPPLGWADHRAV